MNLKQKIRVIEDFPKKGISFKDITTLIKDGKYYRYTIKALADLVREKQVDLIASPEHEVLL